MSIQPLSDIILDVANAADPSKVAAVKQRLAEATGGEFAALLDGPARPQRLQWSDEARSRFFSTPTGVRPDERTSSADHARRGLEQLIAKMMVETMLPKESEATFGKGSAGGVWRSMLADRLASELTRGKGLGLLNGVSLTRSEA